MLRRLLSILAVAGTLAVASRGAAAPRALFAVGELSCGGPIQPSTCAKLTGRLVAELAADPTREVVRQTERRQAQARCQGDPRCLEALRREAGQVVSGTVLPQARGGFQVRLRLLDARTLRKRGEASATSSSGEAAGLGDAVARAARNLSPGRGR